MSSNSQDSGDLSDMAVSGTSVPEDAARPNFIKSVPRPDQYIDSNTLGSDSLAAAADNAGDIPRSNKDQGVTGEVITGTGDQLPAEIESKNLHFAAHNPAAKGDERAAKHGKQKESDLERYAGDGAEVEAPPGEEKESQDSIRDSKGA